MTNTLSERRIRLERGLGWAWGTFAVQLNRNECSFFLRAGNGKGRLVRFEAGFRGRGAYLTRLRPNQRRKIVVGL